jgi:hypothetical protein
MKVEGGRPRLPMDSRGRLSYIFIFRCVCKEMIVGIKPRAWRAGSLTDRKKKAPGGGPRSS